jgi:transmembrane sensor
MVNDYQNPEDLLTSEQFLAWYYKSDPQLAKSWETWMQVHPESRLLVQQASSILEEIKASKEKPVAAERVAAAESQLMSAIVKGYDIKREKKSAKLIWWIASVAAIVVIFLSIGLLRPFHKEAGFKTQFGEIKVQHLPDGSAVTLNANTRITVSDDWSHGKDREVWLKGEAFFHVKRTAEKSRFIVHTSRFDIIVTGTQFFVVNRKDKTNVFLKEGSITVKDENGGSIQMKPGEFVAFENSTDLVEKKTVNDNQVTAWKDKKLVFDHTSLKDVASIIEDHYGVKVTIDDNTNSSQTISGIMPNDNLDVLLNSLEATSEFEIEKGSAGIVIRPATTK